MTKQKSNLKSIKSQNVSIVKLERNYSILNNDNISNRNNTENDSNAYE